MKSNTTTIKELFAWLQETVSPESGLYGAVHNYLQEGSKKDDCQGDAERPFLSVITRTQGKRKAMLTETLLCLTGQSNTDFEVLIMGHNLDDQQANTVHRIIEDLPEWMRNKTRVIPVNGGTRTTPINEGFSAAKGRYIAVLDDDDIVFDNWVDTFYQMAKEAEGRVLHTFVFEQMWDTVGDVSDLLPRAEETPTNLYCQDFEMMRELVFNVCPLFSLAFPSELFTHLGVHFNEDLTTTEDWEYTLRSVMIAGIQNAHIPTGIYRKWKTMESSVTLHSKAEWDKNYQLIQNYLKKIPIIMPSGFSQKAADIVLERQDGFIRISDVKLYYDTGNGFSEGQTIQLQKCEDEEWQLCSMSTLKKGNISVLRFDPCENANTMIDDLKIKIVYEDNDEKIFTISDVNTNGYKTSKGIAFIKPDPQIILSLKGLHKIRKIYIDYRFYRRISNEIVNEAVNSHLTLRNLVIKWLKKFLKDD